MPVIFLGGLCSLGFAVTHGIRYNLKQCNVSDDIHSWFELLFEQGIYASVDIIRVFSFFFFLYETRGYFSCFKTVYISISWYKTRCLIVILVVCAIASLAVIPTAIYSYIRDETNLKECDVGDIPLIQGIIKVHAIMKAFVLLSTIVVSLSATNILYSAKLRWDNLSLENVMIEWNGEEDTLSKVTCKFYRLYNNYIRVGKDTNLERKALKRWFVVTFMIYFIFVLVRVVHIMRIISNNSPSNYPIPDIVHSVLTLFIHFVAFFLPYYAAAELNAAHKNYYRKMSDAYWEIKIVLKYPNSLTIESVTYLCKPGNDIKCIAISTRSAMPVVKVIPHNQPVDEDIHLLLGATQKPSEETLTQDQYYYNKMEEKYLLYYKQALEVQGNIMTQLDEFDFAPSMSNISIPLNSQGYTLTVLLTIFTLILNGL